MKKSKILLVALCAVLLVTVSVLGTLAYLTDSDSVENTFTVGKVTLGDPTDNEAGLDEADVDEYGNLLYEEEKDENGNPVPLPRVQANEYKLLPGHKYIKDPTVHVNNISENSWIFITVDNGLAKTISVTDETTNTTTYVYGIEAATELEKDAGGNDIAGQYVYKSISDQIVGDDYKWLPLMNGEDQQVMLNGVPVYYAAWTKPADTTPEKCTDLVVFTEFKIRDTATAEELELYKDAEIIVNSYAIQMDGFEDAPLTAWNALKGQLELETP